jgi:HK97 family phage portal protein
LDMYQKWRGLPKTEVLRQRLTRMESNMRNSVGQMQNGGTPGVLFAKELPNTSQSKTVVDQMKENFSRFVSNPDNKGNPFIQAGEMGYVQIGSTLVDLDSLDLEKADNKAVCSVWGVSDVLFNSDSAATESNVKEMIRQMYTNAVMPYTRMVDDAFNNELSTDFGTGFKVIKTDFSDVPELQTSMKEKIDSLAAAPTMIPNDVLQALGYDRSTDPMMDEPYIKSGYQPVSDFNPVEPV